MRTRWRVISILVIGLLAYLTFGYGRSMAKQAYNAEFVQWYKGTIDTYHKRTGQYPATIKEAVAGIWPGTVDSRIFGRSLDAWKHAMHYETRGDSYILVSFGSDNQPDGTDYWTVRSANTVDSGSCPFAADVILSDLGIHRLCDSKWPI